MKHIFEFYIRGFYYYEENKLKKIIEKIKNLIEFPQESKETGENAREFIIEKFAMEKILSIFKGNIKKIDNKIE